MATQHNGSQKPNGQEKDGPSSPPPRGSGPGRGPGRGMRIEKAKDVRGTLLRLLGYLRPYKWGMIVVVVLVVISSALSLAGPVLMGTAIDEYVAHKDLAGLWRISLAMLGVYVGAVLADAGMGLILARISQRAMQSLRRDLFEHLQTLSLRFFDQRTTGELMSRLTNDIDAVNRVLSQGVIQLVASGLTLVGMVVVVLLLNVWLALATLAVMPLMLYFTVRMGRGTRRGFREVQANLGRLNALTEETITGVRVVQAFRRERTLQAEFDRANVAVRDTTIRAQLMMTLLRPMLMVFSNLDLVVIAGLGGYQDRTREPGTQTLWRGLQRIEDMAKVFGKLRAMAHGQTRPP